MQLLHWGCKSLSLGNITRRLLPPLRPLCQTYRREVKPQFSKKLKVSVIVEGCKKRVLFLIGRGLNELESSEKHTDNTCKELNTAARCAALPLNLTLLTAALPQTVVFISCWSTNSFWLMPNKRVGTERGANSTMPLWAEGKPSECSTPRFYSAPLMIHSPTWIQKINKKLQIKLKYIICFWRLCTHERLG